MADITNDNYMTSLEGQGYLVREDGAIRANPEVI
jgi:hypothetical protein